METSIVPTGFEFLMNTVRPDGMVNATALIKAYHNTTGVTKNLSQWLDSPTAKDSIAYLERAISVDIASIVIAENGVGTWVHPDLAEILAQWISVEYRFAVVALIRQAKTKVQLVSQRQLAPQRDVIDYGNMLVATGLHTDPLLRALLTQRTAEELTGAADKAINAPETPLNVTSIATQLGYSQKDIGGGSRIGKYVRARHEPLGQSAHGRYQVNVYLPSEVEETIREYFRLIGVS